ncbi:hypothetical protein HN836_03005, partial [Candidatus Woesearchaeota archaeon]|nr:hypothetical protein [Candidatus Woesearchaeota archaeon]
MIFVFLFRMYFSYGIFGFNDDFSYKTVFNIEQIISDPLNMQFNLYYYLLSFFYYLFPFFLTLKIINNIIAVLIILLNYKIAKYITNEENSSLLVALISGFIPIFVIETFNSLNSFNLFLFLFVFQIYNFISFKNKYNIHFYLFILITIILPFV